MSPVYALNLFDVANRDEYLAYVHSLIRRHYNMLPLSMVGGRRGETLVEFVVLDDGTTKLAMVVVDNLGVAREAGDEAGLELLDENERLAARSAEIEAELVTSGAEVQAAAAVVGAAEGEIDREIDALRTRRSELAGSIDGVLVSRYEQLRKDFKGVAVACLEGSRCSGCHLDLSRVEVEALWATPADTLPECPQCARVLVSNRH